VAGDELPQRIDEPIDGSPGRIARPFSLFVLRIGAEERRRAAHGRRVASAPDVAIVVIARLVVLAVVRVSAQLFQDLLRQEVIEDDHLFVREREPRRHGES